MVNVGVELPDGSQFCNTCGTKIDVNIKCITCGNEVPKNSQFCNTCGSKISVSTTENLAVPVTEPIKLVQQIQETKNIKKPGIFRLRNIAFGIIGIFVIFLILCVFAGVLIGFVDGMQSGISYDQTGSSHSNNNPITPTSNAAEQAALSDYNAKINIANIASNTLRSYSSASYTYVDLNDYKSWIDGYKQDLDSYSAKADDEIVAGETYKQYLTAGSSDYNLIINNDAIINDNIQNDTTYYNELVSDYNKKLATQNAANDYRTKIEAVDSSYRELQNYINSSGLFSSLSSTWVSGFGDKVTAYTNACDQAIYSGQTYETYLDTNSQTYAQVSQSIQILQDNENQVTTNYNEYKKNSENLGSLISVLKLIPLLG